MNTLAGFIRKNSNRIQGKVLIAGARGGGLGGEARAPAGALFENCQRT